MKKDELAIFSTSELIELKDKAIVNLKILKEQIEDLPKVSVPAINLIQINELKQKIQIYQSEITQRAGAQNSTSPTISIPPKVVESARAQIRIGRPKKALELLIAATEEDRPLNDLLSMSLGRLEKLEQRYNSGILEEHAYTMEFNRIVSAILGTMNSFQ